MSARLISLPAAATLAAAALVATALADDAYAPKGGARMERRQQAPASPYPGSSADYPPSSLYPGAAVWPEVGPWMVCYPQDYPEEARQQRLPFGSGPARIGVFVPDGAEVWVGGEAP